MSDLECPYCDASLDVCHDDVFGCEENIAHEMECRDCGKNFVFYTSISFDYSPHKADCLNGSPHDFGDWHRLWNDDHGNIVEQRSCRDCGFRARQKRKGGAE